jgi:hypothetical protein
MFLGKQIKVSLADDLRRADGGLLPHCPATAQDTRLAVFEVYAIVRILEQGLKKMLLVCEGGLGLLAFSHIDHGDKPFSIHYAI